VLLIAESKNALFALFIAALMSVPGCGKDKPDTQLKLKAGQHFPTLQLRDRDNHPLRFSLPPNRVSVVNFWATWCPPCRHEMPSLQRLADKLQAYDAASFQVVGISVDDDVMVLHEYLIDKKIRFPVYRDADMRAANQIFGIRAYPSTYIVDRQGRIVDVVEVWRYWDEDEIVRRLLAIAKQSSAAG